MSTEQKEMGSTFAGLAAHKFGNQPSNREAPVRRVPEQGMLTYALDKQQKRRAANLQTEAGSARLICWQQYQGPASIEKVAACSAKSRRW